MTAETPPPALRHAPDWVAGRVVAGRGAASGAREYRELGGSLNAQFPHFLARGLDLRRFARATINVDASPLTFAFVDPLLTLRGIDWHPDMPAEDFSFSPCRLRRA
ncbi:hypothetical protein [Oceanibacterium hippocampi]|uniref:Uncharacterized protein n=1 Tax=Oceanibacterium hippocampi TaxID=745714 RepID=A0A1Y5RU20_9PROT|nr:hypothetical protein [Oceanibacterium hippocampi]SLN24416.1 hypothetical protein OCH7691_00688 [Oceanibacterium hippocampi]